MKTSMDIEIGGGHPFHRREGHFSPMRTKAIGLGNPLRNLKIDVDVHIMDVSMYFKIKFGRQTALKFSDDKKIQDLAVLLQIPCPFPKTLRWQDNG